MTLIQTLQPNAVTQFSQENRLNAVNCFAFDAVGVLVLGHVIFKKYLFFFQIYGPGLVLNLHKYIYL